MNQITTHFSHTYDLATVWAENQLPVRVIVEPVSAIEQVQSTIVELFQDRNIRVEPVAVDHFDTCVGFRFSVAQHYVLITDAGSITVQYARSVLQERIGREVSITAQFNSMVVWVARE